MIEAVGIGRRAGEQWLLQDVSLTLRPGERLALLGPSGSGKTLLLRALALLDPLDAGEIRWLGKSLHGTQIPEFRSRVIYLHQRPVLVEGTVEENLRHPFSFAVHQHKRFDRDQATELLELLGRSDAFLSKLQGDLSGGESQLAALVRAIQLAPSVLLLDEPTAALDAATVGYVEALVAHWFEQRPDQRALIWVSHNPAQAQRVADSRLDIAAGQLSRSDHAPGP